MKYKLPIDKFSDIFGWDRQHSKKAPKLPPSYSPPLECRENHILEEVTSFSTSTRLCYII